MAWGEIIGAPFVWNGRDPEKGLDCYGVVLWIYAQKGIFLDDPVGEYSCGFAARQEPQIRSRFTGCWREAPKPWRELDVVIVRWPHETEPSHLGVLVAGGRKVLHAHDRQGVVCWSLDALRRHIWGVARHEDLA